MKFQQFPNWWMLKSQNRRSYVVAASRVEGRRQPVSPFATTRQPSTQGRSVRRPRASVASDPQPGTQHDPGRARRAAAGLGRPWAGAQASSRPGQARGARAGVAQASTPRSIGRTSAAAPSLPVRMERCAGRKGIR
jgi:hypothetical protein